jgi:hypothetical protein
VDESGALEGVVRALLTKVMLCNGSEFLIHEGHQTVQGVAVSGAPASQ